MTRTRQPPTGIDPTLDHWRARALYAILIIVAAAGLPAFGLPVLNALQGGRMTLLLGVYIFVYLAFVGLAVLPRLPFRLRAWTAILLAYANAVASLARTGLAGSGRLYLLALPVIATVVIGARPGHAAAALSLVLYAVFAALARTGLLGHWMTVRENPVRLGFWIEAGAALALFLIALLVLVERFYRLHMRTLAASRRTAADLERLTRVLREREERLDLVVQATHDGIWDWDLATNAAYYSPRWKGMLGYADAQIANRFESWRDLLHPDDAERALREVQACHEGRTRTYELEHRLRHRNGSYRWILARGIVLRDGSGRPCRMVGSHTDVTEQKQARAELESAYQSLERRVQERTRDLAVVNSIAAVVSRSLDLGEIMNAALDRTMEAAGMESGAAYHLEEETQVLVLGAYRGLSEEFIQRVAEMPLQVALAGRPLNLEQPVVWPLSEYPEGDLRQLILREGLQLMIGVPLSAKGRAVGALVISTRAPRSLAAEEAALLIAVGRQIGLAVENARLYEAERARHEEAQRRGKVAESLREVLSVLNSKQSPEEILQFLIARTCRMLASDAASLLQLDAQTGLLTVQSSCGLDAEYAAALRLPLGKGCAGRALTERRPIMLDDAESAVEWLAGQPGAEDNVEKITLEKLILRGFRALLAVPLIIKDEDYGAITLYYRGRRTFSEEEIQLAASVADQAALAIENARLRRRAEQAAAFAERTRLSRELHDSVTQSLYSATLYAEAAARLLAAGDSATAAGHLRELRTTAQEALREMRLLIFELNPPILEKGGLAGALQMRLDAVEARGGMPVAFEVDGAEHLTPAVRQELYQVAQEALNNVLKHARAQHVRLRLEFRENATRLEVSDDGIGFDPRQAREGGGLGLRGMKERVQRIGGTLRIRSSPGGGTSVLVRVPRG